MVLAHLVWSDQLDGAKSSYPTLGRPTTPIFKLLPGRPKRIFSSVAAFFGGMVIRWDYGVRVRVEEREKRVLSAFV